MTTPSSSFTSWSLVGRNRELTTLKCPQLTQIITPSSSSLSFSSTSSSFPSFLWPTVPKRSDRCTQYIRCGWLAWPQQYWCNTSHQPVGSGAIQEAQPTNPTARTFTNDDKADDSHYHGSASNQPKWWNIRVQLMPTIRQPSSRYPNRSVPQNSESGCWCETWSDWP